MKLVDLQNPNPPNLPQNPPPDFSAFEAGTCNEPLQGGVGGCARWVGKPATFLESQDSGPSAGTYKAARLQCAPFYHDWSTEGVFHVVGAEILPSSTYELQAVPVVGSVCSAPLTIQTARWGDVAAPFQEPLPASLSQPDVLDVVGLVNKVKGVVGAPVKAISQLQPNLPELNADISALDIVLVVDAVKQLAYPYSGPCPCPSAVPCNITSCANENQCTMYGQRSLCVKTCVGGDNAAELCINDTHCPGGLCGILYAAGKRGFCRDRCGRCTPP